MEIDAFRISLGEVPALGERDGEWESRVVKGVTNFCVGSILEDEYDDSADMSKEGSNWIISPPCVISFWLPMLWMER